MKKIKFKLLWIGTFLVVVVVSDFVLRTRGTKLTQRKVEIIRCTNCSQFNSDDTTVEVLTHYSAPSLYKQFISGPTIQLGRRGSRAYLTDAAGKKYQYFGTGASAQFRWGDYRGSNNYMFSFSFPLYKVPKARGPFTFHGRIVVDDGHELPISIVVSKGAT